MQAFAYLAAGDVLALAPTERGVVHLEAHAHRWFVHRQRGERLNGVRRTQGVGYPEPVDAGEGDDVTRLCFRDFHTVEAMKPQNLQHPAVAATAFVVDHHHCRIGLHATATDATDTDDADEAGIIEAGDLHLERAFRVHIGRRHAVHDGLEQRLHVATVGTVVGVRPAVKRRGVDDREVELLFGGTQLVEKIKGLVQHPLRACAGAIHFVDDHDGFEPQRECFAGDEARLWHRAIDGVYQQQHRVHHGQHALHFAAEIGMAGRIHDVDAILTPTDGGVLRQDGDTALALQIIGVHDTLDQRGALVKSAGLLEQSVHECCLAMVDVGDDGDVSEVLNHEGGELYCNGHDGFREYCDI